VRIWAVANQKGGVGKTTTVVALAGLLAGTGYRVLMVDLDPHGSLTTYFGHDPDKLTSSLYNLFEHRGKVPRDLPAQLVMDTPHEGLHLLPASSALATLERRTQGSEGMGLVLSRSLATLWDDYDYVFLDNSPSLGVLMINALAAAQHLLVPVQTEFLALRGLDRMLHTLNMVMKSQRNRLDYTIIPTMFDRRTQASVQSLNQLRKDYGGELWRFAIPVDTRFRDASQKGMVPSALQQESQGIRAYRRLLGDLQEKLGSGASETAGA